jgi:phage replication-related protein YjqB (UPF0714/DUF867 family)
MKKIYVLKAKNDQLGILTEENCTIDPKLRCRESFFLGQQVRIIVNANEKKYGLVTLHSDNQDGSDNNDIRMRLSARKRFGESAGFDAYIARADIKQDKTKAELKQDDEFGEFLDETNDMHTDIVSCAPHGGLIEKFTDEQAEAMYYRLTEHYSKNASAWCCCGWQSQLGASAAWHITSSDISRMSFPKLDQIGDRAFKYAVAFHGYSEDAILIGGTVKTDLKRTLWKKIEDAVNGSGIKVAITTGGRYSGTDPKNFVNWLTTGGAGGIQIEQPFLARKDYWKAIAEAVADVLAGKV